MNAMKFIYIYNGIFVLQKGLFFFKMSVLIVTYIFNEILPKLFKCHYYYRCQGEYKADHTNKGDNLSHTSIYKGH